MNTLYVLDRTRPDGRCEKCKHHQYVIVSVHEIGQFSAMHSWLSKVRENQGGFPYIEHEEAFHWWGLGVNTPDIQPKCLSSYKKIGGK